VLVTAMPGVDRGNLRKALSGVHTAVGNLSGGGMGTACDRLGAYLEWANDAVRTLGNQISAADMDRLVLTKGHEVLEAVPEPWSGGAVCRGVDEENSW
jgi:hypothetical protein